MGGIEFDSATLLASSISALPAVVQHLTAFPGQLCHVVGHTDAVDTSAVIETCQ